MYINSNIPSLYNQYNTIHAMSCVSSTRVVLVGIKCYVTNNGTARDDQGRGSATGFDDGVQRRGPATGFSDKDPEPGSNSSPATGSRSKDHRRCSATGSRNVVRRREAAIGSRVRVQWRGTKHIIMSVMSEM